ncbi:hypothetical protein pb186bvf_013950 [Paramecium bursaria]
MQINEYWVTDMLNSFNQQYWVQVKKTADYCIKQCPLGILKAEIITNELIPDFDKKCSLFVKKHQMSEQFEEQHITFRNKQFQIKFQQIQFKLNSLNSAHVKICIPNQAFNFQIIHIMQEKHRYLMSVYYDVQNIQNTLYVKYVKEQLINYSCLRYQEFFIENKEESKQTSIYDIYVCNFNDTVDYQSDEKDSIYYEDHHRLGNMDQEDLEIYYALYQQIAQYKLSSNTIIRFLIARGFDVEASYQQIMNWIEWRKTNKINHLFSKNYPEFHQIFKIVGESKCGRPVVYTKQALLFPDKINQDRYSQFFIAFLEDVCRSCKGRVDSYMTIVDVDGFGYSNFDLQMTKKLLNLVLQYYPERQNRVFIINTSFVVMGFYKMLKPFLPTRTNDKLMFIGKDQKEINQILEREIGITLN